MSTFTIAERGGILSALHLKPIKDQPHVTHTYYAGHLIACETVLRTQGVVPLVGALIESQKEAKDAVKQRDKLSKVTEKRHHSLPLGERRQRGFSVDLTRDRVSSTPLHMVNAIAANDTHTVLQRGIMAEKYLRFGPKLSQRAIDSYDLIQSTQGIIASLKEQLEREKAAVAYNISVEDRVKGIARRIREHEQYLVRLHGRLARQTRGIVAGGIDIGSELKTEKEMLQRRSSL